jgi:hypothetical protein
MSEPTILCPQCRTEIKLTESLAAPLIEGARLELEQRFAAQQTSLGEREKALHESEAVIKARQAALDQELADRLKTERTSIAADEKVKAKAAAALELEQRDLALAEATRRLNDQEEKLKAAQAAQLEALKKTQELDDAKRELELTIQTRVSENLSAERTKAREEAEAAIGLTVKERDEKIAAMTRQIEELKRRAEQGSQQLQGEVQELELEDLLRVKFPHDILEPVPKGQHGGDILHRVSGPGGQPCGTILWEAKRTKNWSDGWLTKLRDDQRAARADVALIISHALPKGTQSFDLLDGVWVAEPRCAIPVAIAIRQTLIQVAGTRLAGEGQQTKMAMVYNYLIGPSFKHRVEAIVERFTEMHEDLDRERRAMIRLWAKREGQIKGVLEATAGMYGDLQGIAGRTLVEIEGLSLALSDTVDDGLLEGPAP